MNHGKHTEDHGTATDHRGRIDPLRVTARMVSNQSQNNGRKSKSVVLKGIAGVVIAVGGLAFALRALISGDSTVSLTPERPTLLGLAVVLGLFARGTIGANWWAILRSLSAPTDLPKAIAA